MKATGTFLLCVGFYGNFVLASPLNSGGQATTNLKLVATVEGKSFFAYRSTLMFEAGEYCTTFGMTLAEITTRAQGDALKAVYDEPHFIHGHWTAARDAQLSRQFSWNATGYEVSSDALDVRALQTQYQTCLVFWAHPGHDAALYFDLCMNRTQGVLCST